MSNNNPTRVVTGEARLSYVNLLSPRARHDGGEEKYSVTLLIPKTDVNTKQRLDAAIEAAKLQGKEKKWNGVVPPMVAIPIYDGDGVKPSDGLPFGAECKGHWVLSASSKVDQPPKIVDINLNPIVDPTEVYSGMYGRVAVNFAPYAAQGKKGIGCYLSTNVQKTRDGEPLGAAAPAATDDFGGAPQPSPSYGQQQNYGQPQQGAQFQQPQPGQYQTPQLGYAAPQQQQQPGQMQQPGQVQQQFDPITGQPIGGVYGQ
ncbi:DUF2815 family protein [Bacillus safensis]|uniref:DUF2815 family protein n=1 Tax=Bacillus safensis TaxID=561879 RepID=UPI003000150E